MNKILLPVIKIFLPIVCLVPLVATFKVYTDFLKIVEKNRVEAYELGKSQTTDKYEAILKIERSQEWIDTQCMMLNFEWIDEVNKQGK